MNINNYEFLVLFLSDGPNSFQLMAEQLAQSLKIKSIKFIGASVSERSVHPVIREVMMEFQIDIPPSYMLTLKDVDPHDFDLIITLGNLGSNNGMQLPPMVPHFHWDIPDSDLSKKRTIIRNVLENTKIIIQENLNQLFDSDFLKSVFFVSKNLRLILDNLQEGVLAHTKNRKIVFFNKAAEKITGYKKEYVLGRDCHKVFPGRFCGGDCNFCQNGETERARNSNRKVDFKRLDGNERKLKMTLLPLSDDKNENIGALISFKDETELESLKSRIKHHHTLDELVGKDPKMLKVFSLIKEVAPVSASVLIEGESGTGKELVARAIHNLSPRAKKPFIAINCGAIPEGILESELFGHVKGAFTGAIRDKKGRFEMANNGTLFLDEIGELTQTMQVKLLRILQEQTFEQVGGENLISVDVRVISATNQNLRQLVKNKKFRRDLFYRLCVIPIHLPPLREKRMDIITLVEHFIEMIANENQVTPLVLSNEVLDILTGYSWPGNIRELRNAIEYAYVKCHDGVIKTEHFPADITCLPKINARKPGPALKYDKDKIIWALSESKGNRKESAKLLNIGRATLYRYLDTYGLS